jgi:hypothetical protein
MKKHFEHITLEQVLEILVEPGGDLVVFAVKVKVDAF